MQILIIGNGGREHALAWKAAQSPKVSKVYVAPGNAGTALENKIENINIDVTDIEKLISFAQENHIDLTIVGPEAPLVLGIVDQFNQAQLKCFGPTKAASQLEGSKAFTKDFLQRHKIPTAAYSNFTEIEAAKGYVLQQNLPIVIKADGLAAGKGVIIAETKEQAFSAIEDMLAGNKFGDAGHRVVIEEFLQGEEASFIVMVDGDTILPLATSQDHKARDNGDKGPNTGGMGAYSPAPVVTKEIFQNIMQSVITPTVEGMKAEGNPYTGFLYAGLMISENGEAKVLEYNCRFGDPETQPIMMRLESDLVELCLAAVDKKLSQCKVDWNPKAALGVVMAAGGYPEAYNKGDIISGLEDDNIQGIKVFHAGTKTNSDGQITTHGGRVLCVVGLGETVTLAKQMAYDKTKQIHWPNAYFRTDIGDKAINRESS